MSTPTVKRSPVTTLVLSALAQLGKPVGDGQMPAGSANWVGQPMAPGAIYQPFSVVSELNAARSWGGFGDPQSDWQLPYMVECFGITRPQCEALAELVRDRVTGLRGESVGANGTSYRIGWVNVDSLGAPARIDAVTPNIFHSQDGFTVWISKE